LTHPAAGDPPGGGDAHSSMARATSSCGTSAAATHHRRLPRPRRGRAGRLRWWRRPPDRPMRPAPIADLLPVYRAYLGS